MNTTCKKENDSMVTMTKATYQTRIGRAYNQGRIDALLAIGKTPSKISELLDLNVQRIEKRLEELKV